MIRFTDNIGILSDDQQRLEKILKRTDTILLKIKYRINHNKMKITVISG